MNGLIQTGTGRTGQPLGLADQIKVNSPLLGLEANVGHLPGRLETQGGCEPIRDDLNSSDESPSG